MFLHVNFIKMLGFKSIDDFVEVFVKEHVNYCIMYKPDGVYVDYDFDSNNGIDNKGYFN